MATNVSSTFHSPALAATSIFPIDVADVLVSTFFYQAENYMFILIRPPKFSNFRVQFSFVVTEAVKGFNDPYLSLSDFKLISFVPVFTYEFLNEKVFFVDKNQI